MGKMGALLRQKKSTTVYQMTKEQMLEHDRQIRLDQQKRDQKQMDAMKNKYESEVLHSVQMCILDYLCAINVDVLCNKFNWKKETAGEYHPHLKINQYVDAVIDKIGDIQNMTSTEVGRYTEDVYQDTGIKFSMMSDKER